MSGKPESTERLATANKDAIARLRRSCNRLRIWLFIFLALMPLGCAGPLALLALIKGLPTNAFVITSFVLPLVGLAGTLLMLGDRSGAERALAVAGQGEQMGLQFSQHLTADADVYRWQSLEMFGGADEHGSGGNLLAGEFDSETISIEDYAYAIGAGKARFFYTVTLVALPDAAAGVPDFMLTPNSWREKVSKMLGDRTIDFSDQPAFARQFTVRGAAGEAVRNCFAPEVIELCLSHKNLIAEVQNGALVIQPFGKLARPGSYPELASYGVRLAKALRQGARRRG